METLKQRFKDWTDIDFAMFDLAQIVGVMEKDMNFSLEAKSIFWSNDPLTISLHKILDELVSLGVLEFRDEPDLQYKWNDNFAGSWENKGKD